MDTDRCRNVPVLKTGLAVRIGVLIALEVILIAGSFIYIASYESKNALIGNSINIAGKNRFLTATALLDSQYYLSGSKDKEVVEKALDNLEGNILLLRDGGSVGQIEVAAIPKEFTSEWDRVYDNWLAFKQESEKMIVLGTVGGNDQPSTLASVELQLLGDRLIASSDSLVEGLGQYSKENSLQLLNLQIGLGMLNIAVHVIMFYSISRILRPIKMLTNATRQLEKGYLNVPVLTSGGTDELSNLVNSFNKMTISLKDSNDLLAREKKKYQELYDGAPDLYRSVDVNGTITDCNRSYAEVLGYGSKHEIIGHSIFEHTAERGIDNMRQIFEEWKKIGEVKEKEIWMKRKDNTIFPAALSATGVFDENGTLIGSNTVIIDESDRYSSRKALEESNTELKRIDAVKSEFIDTAAHELRSPITPIVIGAELLSRDLPNDKRVATIANSAKKLNRLIGNLLDESRLSNDTFKLVKEKTDMLTLVREVIQEMKQSNEPAKKNIEMVLEANDKDSLDQKTDWNAYVDRIRITEVLTNLLDNAIKFTSNGKVEVGLKKFNHSQTIVISVSDTGVGIDPSIAQKLFQKFSTKSNTSTGTGLGLYLSKKIVEAHEGEIWAANKKDGKGATFTFTIPLVCEPSIKI